MTLPIFYSKTKMAFWGGGLRPSGQTYDTVCQEVGGNSLGAKKGANIGEDKIRINVRMRIQFSFTCRSSWGVVGPDKKDRGVLSDFFGWNRPPPRERTGLEHTHPGKDDFWSEPLTTSPNTTTTCLTKRDTIFPANRISGRRSLDEWSRRRPSAPPLTAAFRCNKNNR